MVELATSVVVELDVVVPVVVVAKTVVEPVVVVDPPVAEQRLSLPFVEPSPQSSIADEVVVVLDDPVGEHRLSEPFVEPSPQEGATDVVVGKGVLSASGVEEDGTDEAAMSVVRGLVVVSSVVV